MPMPKSVTPKGKMQNRLSRIDETNKKKNTAQMPERKNERR